MAGIGHWNTDEHSSEPVFEAFPPGLYNLQVTNSDVKPTKDGKGKYIYVEMTILDGAYAGKKVFDRINLWNANPTAVRIAEVSFNRLCLACGKRQITDTNELHGIPFVAEISVDEPQNGYSAQNRIEKYMIDEAAKTGGRPAPVAAVKAADTRPPWQS